MKINILIFLILLINIIRVKSEFSIISTIPEYLVNSNQDLIFNTIDAPTDINDIQIFMLNVTEQWTQPIPFTSNKANEYIIDKSELTQSYGERLFRMLMVSSNTYTNYVTIGFATPYFETLARNSTTLNLIATGYYLNNTDYVTYLKGITLYPVAPIKFTPPINNQFKFSIEYPYSEIQYIRSFPYLECENTKSTTLDAPGLLPFPQLSTMTWDKIPRKGGVFKYYGNYLYPLDDKNQTTYTFNFLYVNDTTLNPSFECKNISIIEYYGNQNYSASCIIDTYYEPAPNGIRAKGTTIPIDLGSNYRDFYLAPTVLSTSSSFYGTPKEITIKGTSFCISPNVTIGGSKCEIRLSDYENDVLYCNFKSDVEGLQTTHKVSVDCFGQIGSADIFIYGVDECALSENFNGKVCSGNGTCIEDIRKCNCTAGYSGFDCSQSNNGHVNPPIIDDGKTIIETNNSRFDIGLVQIREIDLYNQIIEERVFNLTTSIWNLEESSNDNNEQLYNTTLENGSVIKTLLTINSNDQDLIYDFYGDQFKVLPNSVKYKIQILNWNFKGNLNTLQLIFQTQLSTEQCDKTTLSGQQNVISYENSIRSVELTLVNGQTLVGTFSNRMKIDDRIVKSEVKLLSLNESIGIPSISNNNKTQSDKTQSIQNVYTAILISYFDKEAIIDPNFGLLVSSDVSSEGSCGKKFQSWKIALCVVLPVIGVALAIIGFAIWKGRNRHIITVNGQSVNLNSLNKESKA